MTLNPESRWFGDREVDPATKTSLVRDVFSSVAGKYDVMNDLMSLGIHRLWKQRLIAKIAPRPGETMVDVAGGTGDIALRLSARGAKVTVCDLNPEMVAVGRDRALDQGRLSIAWAVGNAEALPLPARAFDAYTIAFGLRNVTRIDTALAEAYRVLNYGGRFFCLEFSPEQKPGLDRLYDVYSRLVIPRLGEMVARDRTSYEYLIESIRRFPAPAALAGRMEQAGFGRVAVERLSGGIAAIHSGWKL
jgi:demethylmenaquinone methyltransferase/2-methoxy-6-polyprenyl-1,4-benzoquinol methylase